MRSVKIGIEIKDIQIKAQICPMKIIGLFSVVIVLLLAFYPCCVAMEREGEVTTMVNSQPSENDHPYPHPPCSPFYSCSCCAGFSFELAEIPVATPYPVFSELPPLWYCLQKSDGHAHLPFRPPDQG